MADDLNTGPPDDDKGDTDPPVDAPPDQGTDVDDDDRVLTLAESKAIRDEAARSRIALKERDDRIEQLERAQQSEQERAVADAKRETEREVRAEYEAKLKTSALRAAGAGVLHDPEDAVRYIDVERLGPDEARWSDRARKAVDDLLEQRSYLAAKQNGGGEPARGLISGGGRGTQGATKTGDDSEWLRKAARRH